MRGQRAEVVAGWLSFSGPFQAPVAWSFVSVMFA